VEVFDGQCRTQGVTSAQDADTLILGAVDTVMERFVPDSHPQETEIREFVFDAMCDRSREAFPGDYDFSHLH
jgi:hypothetical protein